MALRCVCVDARYILRVRMGLLACLRVCASACALVCAYACACLYSYLCLYPRVSPREEIYTSKIMRVSMNEHM